MYAITIVLEPKPGHEQTLLDACLAVVAASRAEPGNLFFDLLVSDSPREVVFYEAYVDEAAFQAHMAAPHTKAWQEAALPSIERSTLRFPAHRSVAPAS
ncbi:MAG: putative quinol monooxygenase [Polyangiaceae bacterium]